MWYSPACTWTTSAGCSATGWAAGCGRTCGSTSPPPRPSSGSRPISHTPTCRKGCRTSFGRIAAHHRQHRQLHRRAGLPIADRYLRGRQPQIALGHITGVIAGAPSRVRWQIRRLGTAVNSSSPPGAHGIVGDAGVVNPQCMPGRVNAASNEAICTFGRILRLRLRDSQFFVTRQAQLA